MTDRSGKIQTVLGLIKPEDLGFTLTHEHLLVDVECNFVMPEEATARGFVNEQVTSENIADALRYWTTMKDNTHLYDERIAIEEVTRYKLAGGDSIVDATSIGIGRDPMALARISRATDVHIIMGGGYYVPLSHPPDMDERSTQAISDEIVHDISKGVASTGIRTGVIGEVGNHFPMTPNEAKVLRASAEAQVETGAPILIHPGFHRDSPLPIMDILISGGANPKNIIFGHLSLCFDKDWIRDLADYGCYLEFDTFGLEWSELAAAQTTATTDFIVTNDNHRLEMLEWLFEKGYGSQVIISQDNFIKIQMTRFGGKGYAHIPENIVPRMRSRGWTDDQIRKVTVNNPARALTFT
jgi:phosphotriesterase-related protein